MEFFFYESPRLGSGRVRRPGREIKEAWGQRRVRVSENVSRRIRRRLAASRGVARASRGAEILEKENVSSRADRDGRSFSRRSDLRCVQWRFSRDALVPVSGAWHVSSPPDPDATCETEPRTTARRDSMRARRDSRGGRSLEHLRRKRGGASGRVLVTNFERRRVGAGGARDFVRVVAERDRWRARPRVRTSART